MSILPQLEADLRGAHAGHYGARRPVRAWRRARTPLLVATALAAAVVLVVAIGTGGASRERAAKPQPTPAPITGPSGTTGPSGPSGAGDDFVPVSTLELHSPTGSRALGRVAIFSSPSRGLGFELVGEHLPPTRKGAALGVWLVGGPKPYFLGYAPPLHKGQIGTTGPRQQDTKRFARWLRVSKRFIVSVELHRNATHPGAVLLSGRVGDLAPINGP